MHRFGISWNAIRRAFERCTPGDLPTSLSSKLDHPACAIRFSGWFDTRDGPVGEPVEGWRGPMRFMRFHELMA